jgi:hypothetical protein
MLSRTTLQFCHLRHCNSVLYDISDTRSSDGITHKSLGFFPINVRITVVFRHFDVSHTNNKHGLYYTASQSQPMSFLSDTVLATELHTTLSGSSRLMFALQCSSVNWTAHPQTTSMGCITLHSAVTTDEFFLVTHVLRTELYTTHLGQIRYICNCFYISNHRD